jgi:hypothetical protein
MLSHKRDIAEHTHAVALYSSVPGFASADLRLRSQCLCVHMCEGCIHGFHDSADAVKPLDRSTSNPAACA